MWLRRINVSCVCVKRYFIGFFFVGDYGEMIKTLSNEKNGNLCGVHFTHTKITNHLSLSYQAEK